MSTKTDVLIVKGLSKSYGGRQVVKAIDLAVREGEVFGILGPNGAGKTTTLEMIEALRPIDAGTAAIDGVDVGSQPRRVKAMIGVQTQSTTFHDRVRLVEHLEFFASIFGRQIDPLAILRSVQLEAQAKSFFEQLSGGQKQRFSIAIALVHDPKVLFLDEPTASLDPQARRNLWELVEQLSKQGLTIVLTTHYMEEAERLCDRLAIMDDGRIIALDTPAALIAAYKKKTGDTKVDLEDVFLDLTGKALRD